MSITNKELELARTQLAVLEDPVFYGAADSYELLKRCQNFLEAQPRLVDGGSLCTAALLAEVAAHVKKIQGII